MTSEELYEVLGDINEKYVKDVKEYHKVKKPMPCAFKCVITLKPQEHTENFRHQLLFTKKDLKRLEQLNMLLVDNME